MSKSIFLLIFFVLSVLFITPKYASAISSCSFSENSTITLDPNSMTKNDKSEYDLKFLLSDTAFNQLNGKKVFLETGGGTGGTSAFSPSIPINSNDFIIRINSSIDTADK